MYSILRASRLLGEDGVPLAAMAAAAWSCVEKILQLAQRIPRELARSRI